ncbi:c-type heme family protein [Gimesia algae]|uniref:Tll0287-like domain-containing protein n=1 Tax=Gimesia algae TaxID=2527971 RepID=A0A517VHJ5_9PLAN|nr:DUF3365 domain-containing protein [Gimesia algae]QDT92489.1 hypothetical protein Pan161_41560 [Gimesia algae]
MKKLFVFLCIIPGLIWIWQEQHGLFLETMQAEEQTRQAVQHNPKTLPATVEEARIRAKILHETIHGSLQVMHRDFFLEDESITIPSRSLEDVFKELERAYGIKARWLAVNAKAMNIDNEPVSDFEKAAVKVLSDGKPEYEQIADKKFHYAGSIRLASQCLKCHLPQRTSNKDRVAGLVISMPLKKR